jgi:hypothetical protein
VDENPNAYDVQGIAAAHDSLQSVLPPQLDKLWKAGATLEDIEASLAVAVQSCSMYGRHQHCTVTVALS